jgi:tRNA/tmRNA/rRNA uracil-C5-methylase (TrmA/RlmC/RlmD family)
MNDTTETPLELVIEKLVTGGRGLARHEGQAVFVPHTAPGDRVRVRVGRSRGGWREAELLEIVAPGPGRRQAPCPHYDLCGGCDLQHLDPAAQEEARREILRDCLQRLGRLDIGDRIGPTPDGPVRRYRHRIRLAAHPNGHYGLRQRGSHDVVPIGECLVMAEPFEATVLPWLRFLPPVDQIVVRLDGRGGWLVSLYGPPARQKPLKRQLAESGDEAPAPGLQGVLLNNRPQWGRTYLVVHVAGHKYRVSHQSFFQANLAAAETAVDTVRSWLDEVVPGPRDLADLYGGVGLFTVALADRSRRLLTVDSDAAAIQDAEENLRRLGPDGAKAIVRRDQVRDALADPDLREALDWREATVIVDPPRAGLTAPVVAALGELRPRNLVYLSCDPATLARDAAALGQVDLRVDRIQPLPMFPQTAHVETLVLLRRHDP